MSIVLHLRHDKAKRILRGAQHYWDTIMSRHRAGEPFSIRMIDAASNANLAATREFVTRLHKAGILEVVEPAASTIDTLFRPTVIQSVAPRVRRDGVVIESQPGTRCMWNLMRSPMARSGFTYRDLVHWGSTDETRIKPGSAKAYIGALAVAGYLICLDRGRPGTPATWRLDPRHNTGPEAPMILRTKLVFDPNKREVVGPCEAAEVEP